MKCEGCGSEFELVKGRGWKRRVMCYICQPVSGDRKITYRNKHLKRKYGITQSEYHNLFDAQEGKCKICERELTRNQETPILGTPRDPNGVCIDHCHETGVIRGLLCFHCNTSLGHAFDNVNTLRNMITYLEKFKALP